MPTMPSSRKEADMRNLGRPTEGAEAPETEAPETEAPGTEAPETEEPGAEAPFAGDRGSNPPGGRLRLRRFNISKTTHYPQ